jgi:hypothetical protein
VLGAVVALVVLEGGLVERAGLLVLAVALQLDRLLEECVGAALDVVIAGAAGGQGGQQGQSGR